MMMRRFHSQVPRQREETQVTSRHLFDLLPPILAKIKEGYRHQSHLVLAAWPDIVGAKLAVMTQASSFSDGVLVVKVKNSTLHSLLNQNEKLPILRALRKRFPHTEIKNIIFRIG